MRLARDGLQAAGVEITGERFVPLGSTDHAHIVEEIAATRPDCVVNSLIGPSGVTLLGDLAARDASRRGRAGHMVSFNQTEADLGQLGPAADGLVSAGSFLAEEASPALVSAARRRAPCRPPHTSPGRARPAPSAVQI